MQVKRFIDLPEVITVDSDNIIPISTPDGVTNKISISSLQLLIDTDTDTGITIDNGTNVYSISAIVVNGGGVEAVYVGADTMRITVSGVTDGNKGDVTTSLSGSTWIVNDSTITNNKLAQVSTQTFKGRSSAGTGVVEDLTPTQATALLNVATGSLKGLMSSSDKILLNSLSASNTLIIKDEGSTLSSSVSSINFVGGNITASLASQGSVTVSVLSSSVADGDKGDISVSLSGTSWVIDNNAVTNSKLAQVDTGTFKGRTSAGTGVVEDLTSTQATALLNVATGSLKGLMSSTDKILLNSLSALSGNSLTDGDKTDITVSSNGTIWTIDNNAVTNAKLAQVSTQTFKGRTSAGTGVVEDLTPTQATALLNVATESLKGLMSSSDKTKLDSLSAIVIKDEGSLITSTPASINFTGDGVTATTIGNDVTVNINTSSGTEITSLTAYVRSTGSDSNPGTEDLPFLTIQRACDYIDTFNLTATATVTIFLFTGDTINGGNIYCNFKGSVLVHGRGTTSSIATIPAVAQRTKIGPDRLSVFRGRFRFEYVTIYFLRVPRGDTQVNIGDYCMFMGNNSGLPLVLAEDGGQVWVSGVSGVGIEFGGEAGVSQSADALFLAQNNGYIRVQSPIMIRYPSTYTTALVVARNNSFITFSPSFGAATLISTAGSGAITGKRYDSWNNSTIYTANAGANYIPGSIAGTVSNNGLYN